MLALCSCQEDISRVDDSSFKYSEASDVSEMREPFDPNEVEITDTGFKCTLSVRCDTLLDKLDTLDAKTAKIIPSDGIIYEKSEVTFYEGESVFNLLLREMKQNKIHMEFVSTPLYNSAYIEGIANIYEYDCGELSGWMYRVNGEFPNYGCSRFELRDGDVVEWLYTCDLGKDIGGDYAARNGKDDE